MQRKVWKSSRLFQGERVEQAKYLHLRGPIILGTTLQEYSGCEKETFKVNIL